MSELIAIAEGLLAKGVFVMTGGTPKVCINSAKISDDGTELSVGFIVEGFFENFVWHFNVEQMRREMQFARREAERN